MTLKRRIFISNQNPDLMDERRRAVQECVIAKIEALGLQPEMFFMAGSAASMSWSLPNVTEVMRRCVGAVVLGFRRWALTDAQGQAHNFASEYAQIEGALATALNLPLLVMVERGLEERGITWTGAGHPLLFMPPEVDATWLDKDGFRQRFGVWSGQVQQRSDVFLGYCSKSRNTAQSLHLFLTERLGLKVRNWELDFAAAGMILDEIGNAARLCSGGIFLFTQDDALEGNDVRAAPRDNVVFEAGYFAAAKGHDRVLVIREQGAKMPADLGGNIFLELADKNDIRPIESAIRDFVERRL